MTQAPPRGATVDARAAKLGIELRGTGYITPEERHGRVGGAFSLWWAANVEFATIATGVIARTIFGLSMLEAALAILIGNLLGAQLLALLSVYGKKFHTPQLVQSRSSFGILGNNGPSLLNAVAGISWFAVNTVLGVFALDRLLHWPFLASLIVLSVVQIGIAVVGYDAIHHVERWLMWGLTAIFVVASIYGFSRAHWSVPFSAKTAGPAGFSGAFIATVSVAFSYCLGWIAFASDYTRYLRDDVPSWKVYRNVSVAMFVSGFWLELLGAAIGTVAFVAVPTDLVGVLPKAVAIITLIGVVFGAITANVLNLYSGAMSFKVMTLPGIHRIRRPWAALMIGVLGAVLTYVIGRHGFYGHYEEFLFLLGYWVLPWAAILVLDVTMGHASVERMYPPDSPKVSAGLVCWLVAVAASIPFMDVFGVYIGPFASSNPTWGDITYYVSGAIAAVLYGAWLLFQRRRHPRRGLARLRG